MDNPIEAVVPAVTEQMVPKTQLDSVVAELKELRQKKVDTGVSTEDVDKKIVEALQAREREDADRNWSKAQELFIAKNKEFHPDNDPGGVKKAALDRELKLLNRNGLTTIEDLTTILDKAKILATSNVASPVVQVRIDPSLPASHPDPKSTDASNLTPKEQRLIEQMGWTQERYLKLKAKDSSFVEKTLRNLQ